MFSRLFKPQSLIVGALALIPGLLMGGSIAAQSATPTGTTGVPSGGYPVAIHAGSCADFTAQPAYQIDNAMSIGADKDGEADTLGNIQHTPVVSIASGKIDKSLDDLADEGNAVAVHASAKDYGAIIACGDVAGMKKDGQLIIFLNSSENSTVVGIAILNENTSGILGQGKDQVMVTVYLFDTAGPVADATPAS